MAEPSTFRGIIEFFGQIGIYDVVLPFLLVFTIVFAILEKTKIFGVEKVGENEYTKKNLNAMTAFVMAFLVVASTRLVAAINEAMARIVLLLLVSISFLLLIGSFYSYKEEAFLEGGWRTFFMVLMFIGVVLIFMQSIKNDEGQGWLEMLWAYLTSNWSSNFAGSIILIIVLIGIMWLIIKEPGEVIKAKKKEDESK